MNLYMEQIHPALPEEWDAIWRDCSYATYFHSREWAEIWSHHRQGRMRPNPLSVVFSDGKEACYQSRARCREVLWRALCLPQQAPTAVGLPLILLAEHAILMKEFLTKELGYLFWQINPYDDLVAATGVDANIEDETHAINLERGFDAVCRGWSSACRRAERKARKSGILAKISDTEEEWPE